MDYKEKYEQALERARDFMNGEAHYELKMGENIMCWVFPELRESEDNRIRKEFCEDIWTFIPNEKAHKYIAWLEKQEGCELIRKEWLEHIKQNWYKEGFIDGKYSGGTSKEWTINDTTTLNELIDFLENGTAKLQHDLTRYANWLKIQFTPFEKQGEQKPVDKAEPKFKVGDWITDGKALLYITKFETDYGYELKAIDGEVFHFVSPDFVEANYHLWTIQDAKDGDMLCSNQIIVLFKQWEDNTDYSFIIAHAGIDVSGKLQITNEHWLISNESKPATKEQRNTLMKAMADAGYTFDFEKKELKKIEQKPTTIDIDKMVDDYANNKEPGNEIFGRPVPCMVRAYRQGLNDAIRKVVLKPVWSENEMKMLDNLITYLNGSKGLLKETKSIYTDLLKSLKERIKNA